MKRILKIVFFASLASSSVWMVWHEHKENSGWLPLGCDYVARVTGYESTGMKEKYALVEIRFHDGRKATFRSRKSGRHSMFSVGENVRVLTRTEILTNMSFRHSVYEIDNLAHRYAMSVLFVFVAAAGFLMSWVEIKASRKPNSALAGTSLDSSH